MILLPHLVAFDLDGTLAESKQRVSAEMGEALSELLKKMPIAVMSGAGWPQFEKQLFPSLPLGTPLTRLYLFPDNAAQCFVWRDGIWKPQYDHTFSPEEKQKIFNAVDEALKASDMTAPTRIWGAQLEDRDAEIAFSALGQHAPLEEKEAWHNEHESERAALRKALADLLPDYSVSEGGLTTVQITRKGFTKAYGITRLAELTGVPVAQMLYVGDALDEGGNDAVVISTGVRTHQVFSPEETFELIMSILKHP